MWKDVAMAALYYMPFVVTIAFAAFVFVVGFVALLSGTLVVLVLATYGAYSLMRDAGAVDKAYEWMKAMWNFPDSVVVTNLKKSFVLEGLDTIPKGNALYICHPHGMVGYSWFFHFAFRLSEWSAGGPRPLLAMHSILFRIPFARDLLAANRCIEASEDVIRRQLEAGESVAIVLGGVEEMTLAGQERVKLVVKKRKGYSRIARQLGIPIVPVYSEGENELFPAEQNSLWKFTSLWMYKLFKLQFPLPSWKSMKRFAEILSKPLDPPVRTVFLPPVSTFRKDDASIRKECVSRLSEHLIRRNIKGEVVA